MFAARWMLLIWLCTVVLSTVLVGWIVLRHRHGLQRGKAHLQASFAELWFDTPNGRVAGEALTVVKVAYQLDEAAEEIREPLDPWDSLWYAIGPGPSYFLAVCIVDPDHPEHAPQWRVRPLDERRMRAALAGDRQAEMLAFGEAIEA